MFEDQELVGRKPREVVRAGLARTFQNTQLFEEMTAGENVMVGSQARQRRGFAVVPPARRARRGQGGAGRTPAGCCA